MRIPRLLAGIAAGILVVAPVAAQDYLAVDGLGQLFEIDAVTGCVNSVLPAIPGAQEMNAMARRPSDGHLFFAGAWNSGVPRVLHEVDPGSNYALVSSVTLTGPVSISIRGMAFDSSGTLYASNWGSSGSELLTIDVATGACTLVGPTGSGSVQALAWDDANGRLVGWNNANTGVGGTGPGLVHIDPLTGTSVDPSPLYQATMVWEVQGLSFDRNGRLMSVGQWYTQELDPLTGAVLWTGNCLVSYYLRGVEDVRPAGMQLALGGSCPGPMTVELSAGTPGAQAAIAYAFGNTGFTIPTGPCAGTAVQLSAPATLLGVYTLDAQGAFTLGPLNVPANACGSVWVQAIDLSNCEQTAAVQP